MPTEKPITTAALAEHLGLSAETVRRKARAGEWPHHRFGHEITFTPEDVAAIYKLAAQPVRKKKPVKRRPRRSTKGNQIATALAALEARAVA